MNNINSFNKPLAFADFVDFVNEIKLSDKYIDLNLMEFDQANKNNNFAKSYQNQSKIELESQQYQAKSTNSTKSNIYYEDKENLLYLFNERAGIYQFDSGLSQQQSEQKAFSDLVISYANDNNLSFDQDQNQIEEFMQDLTKIIKEND